MEIKKYVSGDFLTNTYVVTFNNKSLVIDPTLDLEDISLEIKSKYNVVGVIITHAHIDHIDGIKYFKDTPIYISKEDYYHLNDLGYNLYGLYGLELPFNPSNIDFHLLNDNDALNIIDTPIRVLEVPGHTKGGLIYVFDKENVAFTGDTLFKGSIGRTDFRGGSMDDILKSIIKILDNLNDDMELYPGHGEKTYVGFEKENNPYYVYAKKQNM